MASARHRASIDEGVGLGAPSLVADIPELQADAGASKLIGQTVPLNANGAVCVEFDLLYEQPSGTFTDGAYAEVLQIEVGTDAHVYVEINAAGFALSTEGKTTAFPSFTLGSWHHVTVRLPFMTGQPSLQLDDDGEKRTVPQTLAAAPPNLDMQLGLNADGRAGTTGAVRIHVDNFHITSLP